MGCDHCQGRHLYWMRELSDPHQLLAEAASLKEGGGTGMLISGGCDSEGRINIGPYVDAIRKAREEYGLLMNVHAGKVSKEDAKALVRSGADAFSLDIHQDDDVIKGPLHRPGGKEDYTASLDALLDAGLEVIPHITVGLSPHDAVRSVEALIGKGIKKVVLRRKIAVESPTRHLRAFADLDDRNALRAAAQHHRLGRRQNSADSRIRAPVAGDARSFPPNGLIHALSSRHLGQHA